MRRTEVRRASLWTALFTLTVLITLGLGIGVNTATFQVVNEVLLRPLPFSEPERLVFITTEAPSLNIVAGKVSQQAAHRLAAQHQNRETLADVTHSRTSPSLLWRPAQPRPGS